MSSGKPDRHRKKPVELVKCETVDVEMPANAEIVVEGYVDTEELRTEGPFGDHTGYYSLADEYPVFHLTRLTHRKNPIYHTTIEFVLGPVETLDHASRLPKYGSKMGVDATRKWPEEGFTHPPLARRDRDGLADQGARGPSLERVRAGLSTLLGAIHRRADIPRESYPGENQPAADANDLAGHVGPRGSGLLPGGAPRGPSRPKGTPLSPHLDTSRRWVHPVPEAARNEGQQGESGFM